MYKVRKILNFSSAHYLRNYKGKCEELHGHNWKVEVIVASDTLDEAGMVIDFVELKKITNDILDELDHKCLNDLAYFKEHNPSSENIAQYIYEALVSKIKNKNCQVDEVRVWETDTSCAIYCK